MQVNQNSQEEQWLQQIRQGDERALKQIFEQHYPLLLRDIFRLIPEKNTCKDLAQEVFVELWRKRENLGIHSSLRAYLRRAAINKALNYIKTQKLRFTEESEKMAETADSSEYDLQLQERQEDLELRLHQAIEALPEKCRIVFSLSRFEQLSHKEIAQKLDISVKTIENQITKAMKFLRDTLNKYPGLSSIVILLIK